MFILMATIWPVYLEETLLDLPSLYNYGPLELRTGLIGK